MCPPSFANATRFFATRYHHLWPAGLLQLACFYGRNSPFVDVNISPNDFDIEHLSEWKSQIRNLIFDHGIGEPIVSTHLLKTAVAVWEEGTILTDRDKNILWRSFQRFVQSPLKRKHARRITKQAFSLVSKDFPTS